MHQIINQSDEKLFRERFIIFFSFTHGVKMRHLTTFFSFSDFHRFDRVYEQVVLSQSLLVFS